MSRIFNALRQAEESRSQRHQHSRGLDRLFMTVVTADRRGAPRVKVSLPVRLRRLDSKHPGDICTTLNTSRDGLHLLTFAAHYLHERKVRVVRNFRPNDPANHEEIGDVVRIEKRGGGEWGVAIRIATPATSHSRQKTRF